MALPCTSLSTSLNYVLAANPKYLHRLLRQTILLLFSVGITSSLKDAIAEPDINAATQSAPATQSKKPSANDVRRWVRELGHDSFSIRQDAAEKLLAAGMIARGPLLEVAAGPDPETRAAARRLVALIDRTEFRHRLDAFAADTDGKLGLTLPGWEQFQKIAGSDANARALFVDMQRQEAALLAAAFGTTKRLPEDLWAARLLRVAQWQVHGDRTVMPSMGSCAAMIFLATLPEMNVSDIAAQQVQIIVQRPPIKEQLAPDASQAAVRKLVVTWLLHCPNSNEDVLRQRLGIIASSNLKDALPLALQVCDGGPEYAHIQPLTKAVAVLIVGQIGGREHIARLEPLLEDASVCVPLQQQVPGQPATSVQVRDVVLNVIINLSGQSPADYGYLGARMASPRTFNLQTLYRDNDQQRSEAITKWRGWRAAHKEELKAPGR